MTSIRLLRPGDLPVIQEIEAAAGALFRDVGMPDIADHPLPSIETLAGYQRAGHGWVAVDHIDRPVGFILMDLVDGNAHIEQVSVHPRCARRGIGRELINQVAAWAAEHRLPALTLTTFPEVPWNGPYYERLGFARVTAPGPELTALLAREAEHGLDPANRTAMIRMSPVEGFT